MSLSPEMTRYITTGHCPRCDVVILDQYYVTWSRYIRVDAERLVSGVRTPNLVPADKVEIVDSTKIRCLTCNKTWWIQPVQVDLRGCQMTGRKDERQIEEFLSRERKEYRNNSSVATLTKEVSISNSITRTVTIESNKVTAHNAQASVTIFGFGTIQAVVQQQLSETYSVAVGNTLTISETTTIEIPPSAVVEHIIQWKLVSWNGIAILGPAGSSSSSSLAEVPFRVPHRLTYTDELNDVPRSKK